MAEIITDKKSDITYIKCGNGSKTMVVIPGIYITELMKSAEAIESRFSYFKDYTVYFFQRKNVLPEGYSVKEMAADTAALIKDLGLSDIYLYGVSQGGIIAQFMAGLNPGLAKKLVLASTSYRANEEMKAFVSKLIEILNSGDLKRLGEAFCRKLYTEETIKAYPALTDMAVNATPLEIKNFKIMAEACLKDDPWDYFDKITCPALVIAAKEDVVCGYKDSLVLAEKLACRLITYEYYRHAVYDEAPDFLERIGEFFDETDD